MIRLFIKQTSNRIFENILKNIIQNTPTIQILVTILEPIAWLFRLVARFVCDLLFGTSGGYPLGPILASHGAPLVRCARLFGRFLEPFCSE